MSPADKKRKKLRHAQGARAAILAAAVDEFAVEGPAGARTDEIASAAGVNKAMLYYYFKDKDALHQAVLDQIFTGLLDRIMPALGRNAPPRERLLAYARAHFDYVASSPNYPRIVQWEMMRASRVGATQISGIVTRYFKPIFLALSSLIEEGKRSGDFRPVDPRQFVPSMIGVIVSFFVMRPSIQLIAAIDPRSPEVISQRRAAVLDFISHALFTTPANPHLRNHAAAQVTDLSRRRKPGSSGEAKSK